MGLFKKIFTGLDKTRKNILTGIDNALSFHTKIDDELFDDLEEALIVADIGAPTAFAIIENLRAKVKADKLTDAADVKAALASIITEMLTGNTSEETALPCPAVILIIGVNGVGKTTTIGKLAANFKRDGKSVLLAAGDTFRAAAIDQLEVWADRAGAKLIRHQEGSDPGAVIFDAVQSAKSRNVDVLICDTAGRLHNKKNLMDELKKIHKIIDREYPDAHKEVFLVLDATTGQNALQQAKLFKETADITGLVLTKLDGTAKGGVVLSIKNELDIPVKFIGVGEQIDDLQPFDAQEFASALFNEPASPDEI